MGENLYVTSKARKINREDCYTYDVTLDSGIPFYNGYYIVKYGPYIYDQDYKDVVLTIITFFEDDSLTIWAGLDKYDSEDKDHNREYDYSIETEHNKFKNEDAVNIINLYNEVVNRADAIINNGIDPSWLEDLLIKHKFTRTL